VNSEVVSQHAEEAAFLWSLRDRAVQEPHYALKDLAALDERVEAHLDGLRIAGTAGWDFCKANLIDDGPGEIFALAVLAFSAGHRERMTEVLNIGCTLPNLRPGLISAMGWLDFAVVAPWALRLLEAKAPLHRAIGIAACAVHREDPGTALELAIGDVDPFLCARALRCAGEIKRRDLLETVRNHLPDEREACQFWAAWTVTLLGDSQGVPILTRFALENDAFRERALHLVLRAIAVADARLLVRALAREPHHQRSVVMATGILGDPVSIPWLIQKMESPELARLAGEAFTMITGVDLSYQDLNQEAPPEPATAGTDLVLEEVIPVDYETNLPWPSATLVTEWWEEHRHAFRAGTRYLGGKPITQQSAREVLVGGRQRLRAAAALELALLDRDLPLFEVRIRGSVQQKRLEKLMP